MRNDVVKYINSQGQEQFLSKGNCLCNTKALREFLYTVQNKRLYSNRQKTIVIELLFHGSPTDRDKIIDILEVDSILNTYGRLYVNDWYILSRFVGIQSISKEGYNNIRMDLQFVADTIEWSKETNYELSPFEYPSTNYVTNDYPSNFPHDYAIDAEQIAQIFNNQLSEADIRVTAEITSAMVTAGEIEFSIIDSNNNSHEYSVDISDYTVLSGYIFKLDTQAKTVEISAPSGSFSVFGGTVDNYYIFEKINTGMSVVESDYPMSIDVIEHRRFPEWKT